jgi:hypothetical protein
MSHMFTKYQCRTQNCQYYHVPSQASSSVTLLLMIAGNYKVQCWDNLEYYNVHTKYHKYRQTVSKTEMGGHIGTHMAS